MTFVEATKIGALRSIGGLAVLIGLFLSSNASAIPILCTDSPQTGAQRALIKALVDGDSELALALIPRIPDLNFHISQTCGQPLDSAIRLQSEDLIRAMVNHGAKPSFSAAMNEVSVAYEAGKSEDDILRVLQILQPVIPNGESDAVITAARAKEHRVMSWLVMHGANIYGTFPCGGNDAVQTSMSVDDGDGVALLLNAAPKGSEDDNPLVSAVVRGKPEMVKLLLARGTRPNIQQHRTEFVEDSSPADAVLTMLFVVGQLEIQSNEAASARATLSPKEQARRFNLFAGSFLLGVAQGPEKTDYSMTRRSLEAIAIQLKAAGARPGIANHDPHFRTSFMPCD